MAQKRKYKKRKRDREDQRDKEDQEEREDKAEVKFDIRSDAKRSVAAIFLFAMAILFILGFLNCAGILGEWLDKTAGIVFGWGKWLLPLVLVYAGAVLLRRKKTVFYVTKLTGLIIVFLSALGFFHIYFDSSKLVEVAKAGAGGGYIGCALSYLLVKFTGTAAATIILLTLLLAGVIVTFNFSIVNFWQRINALKDKNKKDNADVDNGTAGTENENENENEKDEKNLTSGKSDKFGIGEKEKKGEEIQIGNNIKKIEFVGESEKGVTESENSAEKIPEQKKNDIKISTRAINRGWQFPPLSLLEESNGNAKGGDTGKNAEIIQSTLKHFGIEVELAEIKTGPTVTQYSFRPAVGVKLNRITSLSNNLALALAAKSIRIEAPIPGKALIGIEAPNKSSALVKLKDILESGAFQKRKSKLALPLGQDVSGNCVIEDLEKMPHLMIAGATGAGKSICINTILLALLYQNSPEDLNLLLVDPKRVELTLYNGIPHLISDSAIVESGKAINALKWAIGKMEERYRLFQDTKSRDMASYNQKVADGKKRKYTDPETGEEVKEDLKKLPFIVIIIDELADLMASHGKEVEGAIIRLAQMARAVGIHLIISTQRPSVEVLTGLIKANITSRIALQVATQIDSRTILDMGGAEKLLGNGDMLFLSANSVKPKRIQGVYVSESEVKKVVKFIKNQKIEGESAHNNSLEEGSGSEKGDSLTDMPNPESFQQEINFSSAPSGESGQDDSLYEEAKSVIIKAGKASSSLLQRRLRIGYARAARLIDTMEDDGIVSPAEGSKPRKVIIGNLSGDSKEAEYEDPIKDQEKRDKWQT